MDETIYSLSLSGEDLDFEREVNQQTAGAVMALVLGGGASPPSLDLHQRAPATSEGAGARRDAGHPGGDVLSLGEFIEEVAAKRNPDKIVTMGVYLDQQRGKSEFTTEDIKPLFQEAQEPPPANFSRDWRWAQSARWIAPVSGSDKNFYVTKTGRTAVDNHFPTDVRKRTTQPAGKKTLKKSERAE